MPPAATTEELLDTAVQAPQDVDPTDEVVAEGPTIISSTPVRDQIETDQATLAKLNEQLEIARQQALGIKSGVEQLGEKEKQEEAAKERARAQGGITPEELQELQGGQFSLQGFRVDEASGLLVPTTPESGLLPGQQQLLRQRDEISAQSNSALQELEALKAQMNAANQAVIQGIQDQFSARRRQMEDINKRRFAQLRTTGIRTGAARFAPEIQGGFLAAEEREGIQRIAELNAQEAQLIAAANAAAQAQNFKFFGEKMRLIEREQDERQEQIEKMNAIAIKRNKELLDAEALTEEQARMSAIEGSILDLISQGIKDPIEIARAVDGATFEQVNDIIKEIRVTEKAAPGIVGEWLSAIASDPALKGFSLEDYMNLKDPTRALDVRQQKLQIAKLERDLSKIGGIAAGYDPIEILAFAQQYSANGRIPTGLPKGSFGIIAQTAMELPKQRGAVINSTTGVSDNSTSATVQQDFTRLYNIVNNAERLKEIDKLRSSRAGGGLVGGALETIFGTNELQRYLTTRKAIVDDLQRMQSGAALTAEETAFYAEYLPGRFYDTEGVNVIGQSTQDKIDMFAEVMNNKLRDNLSANNLSVVGYSQVTINGQQYTVGDIVTNAQGKQGRVNANGTITILE